MKLHEALKRIVEKDGIELLMDKNIVNIISDYYPDVFKPVSLKKICKYVFSGNYVQLVMGCTNEEVDIFIPKFTEEIVAKEGFSEEYTTYVLRSLAFAVGFGVVSLEKNNNEVSEKKTKKDKNHLYFKDVRIYGDSKEFVNKVCENGFSIIKKESTDSNYMLKGSYAGMDCKLMVQISPLTHRTSRVMVIFDDKMYKNWPALKSLYFNLKNKLTKKYGKPSSETEAFFPPYKDGCGKEIKLLDENKGAYQSKYETSGGEIRLVIMSEARVVIAFFDTLGCIELDREFEQAAQDDM